MCARNIENVNNVCLDRSYFKFGVSCKISSKQCVCTKEQLIRMSEWESKEYMFLDCSFYKYCCDLFN